MKVTHILTALAISVFTSVSSAESFKSTKIKVQIDKSEQMPFAETRSAIVEYLEASEIWTSKEDWDEQRSIHSIGKSNTQAEVMFMSALLGRMDMILIKESESRLLVVNVLSEVKHSYETNRIEESILEIEKIMRGRHENVTRVTEDFAKDLIAKNKL